MIMKFWSDWYMFHISKQIKYSYPYHLFLTKCWIFEIILNPCARTFKETYILESTVSVEPTHFFQLLLDYFSDD